MADNTAYQDLLKDTSESKEDGNYFLVTITDLNPNTSYPLQFRWMYKDKRVNDSWSAVKLIVTPGESQPNTPKFGSSNVDVTEPEKIIITWDGTSDDVGNPTITNYDRVDVYISGTPFDGSKAAYSFKAPGTTIIPAPAGTYMIALYAISKTGTVSPVSSSVTKTVLAAGVPIETPTLPTGLSVSTAPFAVSVNWDGTYSGNDTFTGFKSIDIYAVGSDLGSSVTSGITSTNLVGSLTVNDTTNRINIGLDNLRQALSLSTNSEVYNSQIFYYYNAVNTLGEKYKSSGSVTYTRISPSSVVPTKANFIDLASGVISIENLTAGNGNFASYLRIGSSQTTGGARIELSGVDDFTDSNTSRTVKRGLTAYDSGNVEVLRFDYGATTPKLTIKGDGTFTGNLEVGSGNAIFKADSTGIYLGNATYASAPFSVSSNGVIKAESGKIGGWDLNPSYLKNSADTIRFQSVAGSGNYNKTGLIVGDTTKPHFTIEPTGITHRNADGTASGKFTLSLGDTSTLTLSGSINVTGGNAVTSTDLSTGLAGKISTGGALGDIGTGGITATYLGSGAVTAAKIAADAVTEGKIAANAVTTGKIAALAITSSLIAADAIVSDKIAANAIIAGKIASGAITTDKLDAGAVTAAKIAAGTITATEISSSYVYAGELIGNVIRTDTASTYPRIGINETSNQITFNTVSGHNPGNIYGYSAGSYGVLRIGSPYAGGYTQSYITLYSLGSSLAYVQISANVTTFSGGISTTAGADIGSVIYANNLGTTGSGLPIYQVQSGGNAGYLKVFTSSRRFKDNIENISSNNYIDIIDQITPVTYKEKDNPDSQTLVGLIAEDLANIPKMENFVVKDSEGMPYGINYDRISVALILALKEIKSKLENIEQRLDALEA